MTLFYRPPFYRSTVSSFTFQLTNRLWSTDFIRVFKFRLPSFFFSSAFFFLSFFRFLFLSTFSMLHSGVKVQFFLRICKLKVRLTLHNMNVPSLTVYWCYILCCCFLFIFFVFLCLDTVDGVIEAGMSSATARNMSILQHVPFVVPFKDRVKVIF